MESRIGANSDVAIQGSLNIFATAEDEPELSASSSIDSGDPTSNDPVNINKDALSVAISIGNVENNATAYIGENAIVDVGDAIAIQSKTSNPLNPTFLDIFEEEYYLDRVDFNPFSDVNNSTDKINVNINRLKDGETVTYHTNGGEAIDGLSDGAKYKVIITEDDQVQLRKVGEDDIIDLDSSTATGTNHYFISDVTFNSVTNAIIGYIDYINFNLGVQNGLVTSWSQSVAVGEGFAAASSERQA